MSNQNVKINLLFQADTSAAVNNMQQLNQLLNKISTGTKIGIDEGSLYSATKAAQSLQIHLQNALNTDTGKLDLSKLNTSLKQSGHSLQSLTTDLQKAGVVGQQAFINIANSIAQAQTPTLQFGQKLKDFGVTLANTAKWQIASNAMHGIEGMMSSAVQHAEDLNHALNDIRIVTGYSAQTMASFAEQASEAAQALSTTTTEYAKAALIFYQQGLSGDDVTERADVVVKLSQVTGQSAQQVSDQMTAIWNNFDDGSQSLEYYADVLAKLGAATAADTQEITDGLSKFAAVADTVGLSYETSAAAVATVVDKTKQSADVVGTSFKTIFARIQGLKLGETLEDGVDLNKYSEALSKVGIQVLDAKGEMRDMDDILNELGEKWDGFGETTQTAIAQTVGGIRQYNQMMALMDNWDSVKENIDLAKDATGELTKQQQIWSEGYEASAQRVKQAQNKIYESFINSEDIVKLNDIFAEFLEKISDAIDAFGGVLPLVLSLAGVFSKFLFPLIQQGMTSLINNINVLTGKASKDIVQMQNLMKAEMSQMMNEGQLSQPMQQQILLSRDLITEKQKLAQATKHMSIVEAEEAQQRMQVYEAMVLQAQESLERQEALRKEIELSKQLLTSGTNKAALSMGAAKNVFAQKHQDVSKQDIDSMAEEAMTTSRGAINNKLNSYTKTKADLQFKLEDAQTDPGLSEKERTKQVETLTKALNKLEQEEKEQITRYEHILELQREMNVQSKKDTKDLSVGKVEGFFTDTEEDSDPTTQGMIGNVTKDLSGAQSTEFGSIEVDASISNLESLIIKMSEYQNQALTLDQTQQDLVQTFFDSEGPMQSLSEPIQIAATVMDDYKQSLAEVENAELEYQTALENVAKAQDNKNKSGRKDKQATEALKKAKEQLEKAEKKLISSQTKSSSILNKSSKSGQSYVKSLISLEKTLKKAAASSNDMEKELKEINSAFDQLKKGNVEGLNKLNVIMERLKVSSSSTANSIDVLAAAMQEQLLSTGMTTEQLNAFVNQLLEIGAISPEIANKLRLVDDTGDGLNNIASNGDLAVSALQGVATAAGSVSMAVSGIKMFTSAFEEGNTILDSTMAILSGLTMIIPTLIGGYKAINAVKKAKIVLDAASQAGEATNSVLALKTVAANAAQTTSFWALAAAKLASLAASNPALAIAALAVIGVTTAAIIGQTIATEKQTKQQEKLNETTIEGAEKANEASSAWAEQSSTVDSLIAQYRSLSDAGEDLTGVQEDLKNSATEVCDAYTNMVNIFSGLGDKTFKDLQGNIISYAEAIDRLKAAMAAGDAETTEFYKSQLDTAITPEAMKAAQEGATAAMNATAAKMAKDGGAKFENNTVTRHVGGVNSWGGAEETDSVNILKNAGVGTADGETGFNISLSTNSSGDFLNQYEKLLAAKKQMENELGSKLDNSDTYREVSEMLEASEEEYEKLKELQKEADKYGVISVSENLKSQKFSSSGEAMDVTNINSLKEYDEYRTKILTDPKIKDDPVALKAAEDWLAAQGHLGQYEEARLKMEHAKDVTGLDEATLTGIYDGLSEEQKKLFLEVDFNQYQTKAAIEGEIERLQKEADKAERVKIAEEFELDADELEVYRNLIMSQNKEMRDAYKTAEDYEQAMTDIAVANKRMEKGVKKIADGWEDFDSIMSDSTASAEDISTVLPEINEGLQDVLNLSDEEFELLPPDFAQKNWSLIQDVVNGVEGSVDTLRDKAGEEMLLNINGTVDADGKLKEELAGLHNEIASFDSEEFGFKVGVDIDDTNFIQKCNDMIAAAGMTKAQAEAYFASMGYDAEIEEKKITNTTTRTVQYPKIDSRTGYPTGEVGTLTLTEESGTTGYAIKSITPSGSYGGGVGVNTTAPKSSTAGKNKGGGSKPKKTSEAKKSKEDIVERYKEVNDELEAIERQMKKNSLAAEGLWGAKRIAKLKENIRLMKEEYRLLKDKQKLAALYLKSDRQELDTAARDMGISLQYNQDEEIANYTEQFTKLFEERKALLKSFGDTMDEKEQERLDEFDKKLEILQKAYDKYNDTLQETFDLEEQRQQEILDRQTEYYNVLKEELEVKITIDDSALEELEYYLGKTADDFYQMYEAAALMVGEIDKTGTIGGQMPHYFSQIDAQKQFIEDLDTQHNTIDPDTGATQINDEQYKEGLLEAKSNVISYLQSLNDLDDKMMHYYGDTLAAAAEELSKYTTLMEHQTSVLEHYANVMDILGQSQNYEKMGVILEAQAKTIGNEAKVAKENYEMLKRQSDAREKEYNDAVARGASPAELELLKQRWMDAENAANEAQENMLSKTEQWAEAMKAVVENKLNEFGQALENALTKGFGGSFDNMNNMLERANSLQEEYLTTTNKIYETNKLMHQAQQEIDKTTNTVAKKRLKNFVDETNQLQNKNKLSQYELEIQQAKYDLVLAQIALEEAQNAKSTVRLQRDSEGNFGYVYTADQTAIAEAQQKFEDAQNALYNIGLEGANSYTEKYQQTLSEFYSTMTELQHQYLNGEFENEQEYQEAMISAREYYYEKLKEYSSLYSIALTADGRIVEDAWSTQFQNMIYGTEEWMFAVDEYVNDVGLAFAEWEEQMRLIEEETIGPDLTSLQNKTAAIANESERLAGVILDDENGVLKAMEDEINSVARLTGAYAGLREEIQGAITKHEELLAEINKKIEDTSKGDKSGEGDGSGNNGDNNPPTNTGSKGPYDDKTKRGVALAIWNGSYGWGTGDERKKKLKEKGFDPTEIQDLVNDTDPSAGWGSRYGISDLSKYAYSKFDTGGYTGAWGSYGKMAMLHEKELVLNKQDTENFLTSMEFLDNIIKTIDLQTANSALGGLLNSPSFGDFGQKEILEQNVKIEASFPNVQNRTEIEEAFETLINQASQYANRR